MNAAGRWNITLQTPMGPQDMQLHITRVGQTFEGRTESSMGAHDITGTVTGATLSWVMNVKKPIPVKVSFTVTVEGDALHGFAKAGLFGKATLKGQRIADDAAVCGVGQLPEGPLGEQWIDPLFDQPYVDVDQLRSQPVPHRYVHGGFKGTDARFSFYFPPAAQYQGRFFHNTYPLAVTEDIAPFPIAFDVAIGNLPFTLDSGAYYVQTNLGGADRMPPADPSIGAYRVNAAAAKYSRTVAAQIYGPHRPYGYLFGGSGGSYQVIGAAENTDGIWDGFLPFVMATPNAIPSMFTVRMHALRVLRRRNRLPGILDAIDPGGSGDPYAGLDQDERAALHEVTRMGFPPRGWWDYQHMSSGYFSHIAGIVPLLDPGYLEEFWSRPGYLGSDPRSGIGAERLTFDTQIQTVIEGFQRQVELACVPARDFSDAHLVLIDGPLAGRSAPVTDIHGRRMRFSVSADPTVVQAFKAGDRVRIDNAWPLALQTYHRHQVPAEPMCGWDQFRDSAGAPIYPQRELLIGPVAAAGTAGSVPEGRINGKMLALECLMDIDAMPWQADWYRTKVRQALGERFEDHFALWFIDHAQHDNPASPAAQARTVSYAGALQQGLRDLAAWAEQGQRPADTRYAVVDSQVVVPPTAAARGGIQPVVELAANGALAAEIGVGESVTFRVSAEVPANAGTLVRLEWDFEGQGQYLAGGDLAQTLERCTLQVQHCYRQPGTYFPVVRVSSQRQGDPDTPFGRIQNLARLRVTVR